MFAGHIGLRRGVAALAGLLALAAAASGAARRPVAVDDLLRLRDVSDPEISPDGAWVAYTVAVPDAREDRSIRNLWMTSWDGSRTLRLTSDKASESSPRFSPDGRYLAFLSARGDDEDVKQLWLLPTAGGEAEKVTEFTGGVSDYDWSPDGRRVVLVVEDPDPESADAEKGAEKEKESGSKKKAPPPIVIDRFQFKEDETGYLVKKRSHLRLLDVETRRSEVLTSGDYYELLPAWSPDGRWIAFVTKRGADFDRTDNWDVYLTEPRAGAAARRLTEFEGADNEPDWESRLAWSPDSTRIAYLQGGPAQRIYYAVRKLAVVPVSGGSPRILTPDLDRNVSSPRFTPDGSAVDFLVEDDRTRQLARVAASGGPVERILSGRRVVSALSMSRGGRVAVRIGSPEEPEEIFALDNGEARRLSHQNDAWLAEVRLARTEETSFSSRDRTEIHGFLVLPPGDGEKPARPNPAILRIHGGPVDQFESSFDFEWQLLAANGYTVVAANPRGSSGRGEKFSLGIWADWGRRDAEDVLAAVDDAVRRGVADPARLGVGGWSYGGMLTNYVIAQDRRFRAAVSGASISNILAGYGTDQYVREYEAELGPPWKSPDAWIRVSFPFLHADRIRTPTLFLCGDADFNVPLLNSEQMYQALRSLGVETQLVIYPGQHHGIRRPSYLVDRLQRYVLWYERHVKAAPGRPPASTAR